MKQTLKAFSKLDAPTEPPLPVGDNVFPFISGYKIILKNCKVYSEQIVEFLPNNTVKLLSDSDVMRKVSEAYDAQGAVILHRHSDQALKTWKTSASKIDKLPPSFSLDKNEVAFKHIKLDIKECPTPTWDDFVRRCGLNGEALMAFVWSLFERDCKSNQYLLLRGSGKDGKSTFTTWLTDIFGTENTAALSSGYDKWPAQCVGKRLGLFAELNDTKFIMSENFKKITGRDLVMITEKYEKAYSTVLDAKFILTTNKSVQVSGGEAEKRRIILCDMETGDMPNYVENIYKESPGFLHNCQKAYKKLYNPDKKIIECASKYK
jgi:putative DNA primase/helicase